MKIDEYHLRLEPEHGWVFPNTKLDRVNLIVGDSGAGKTRFLNTLSNFAKQATADSVSFSGDWTVVFTIGSKQYQWDLVVDENPKSEEKIVSREILSVKIAGVFQTILSRDGNSFTYGETKLPKLSRNMTSISLLKDEDDISSINAAFKRVQTRRFFTSELSENFAYYSLPTGVVEKHMSAKDLDLLLRDPIGFQNKIFILEQLFPQKYKDLLEFYKEVFPFVKEFSFQMLSDVSNAPKLPFRTRAFCFKEQSLDRWIPVNDISSGMQKVFLLALDVYLMPEGGIMLIDEYENSLGVNAINFFPDLLIDSDFECQFILSSHHPYLINRIPIDSWLVFHRKGVDVSIKSGKELKEKFGKSRQLYFTQLLNDPFYNEGIE